jgi:hypothetical protein
MGHLRSGVMMIAWNIRVKQALRLLDVASDNRHRALSLCFSSSAPRSEQNTAATLFYGESANRIGEC